MDGLAVIVIILTVVNTGGIVFLLTRKTKKITVNGYTIEVANDRFLIRNNNNEIIFNTGK